MTLAITGLYATILGPLFIIFRTIVTIERAKSGISIYYGDNMVLGCKIRALGNFTEVVPYALILMGAAETMGAGPAMLHAIAGSLLILRLLLPLGLNPDNGKTVARIAAGTMVTLPMLIAIGFILWQSLI